MPCGLEDRESDVPPCDSLAEAIVLSALLCHPELIPQYSAEVRPLLVFPEHRLLLTAIERAYAATPRVAGEPWSRWIARVEARWLMQECERAAPGRGWIMADLIAPCGPIEAKYQWEMRRWQELRERFPEAAPCDFDHPWTWWLERLKKVSACRRIVDEAQEAAALAWRGDLDGASAVVRRMDAGRSVVRVVV